MGPFRVFEGGKPSTVANDDPDLRRREVLTKIGEARMLALLGRLVLEHGPDETLAIAKRGVARLEQMMGR